ncbi:MAG TPA: hypothetical protein DEA44_11545 [Firmicutes bacterium]|nr:hypothetical protein [Bacillota bacterium]HWR55031.1 hypothetical protein [Negativicutes bacterium]
MKWRQYDWLAGGLAVCFTVALLFGGQLLWQKLAVAQPLDKAFLNISGVTKTTWDNQGKSGEPVKIYVTLQNVANLAKTHDELNNQAKKVLGKKPFKIVLQDNRSAELEQFNYEVQYMVQEAIVTGRFSVMEENLAAKARARNIDLQIYVDGESVYLQTAKDTAQMYVIIPRTGGKSGGEIN